MPTNYDFSHLKSFLCHDNFCLKSMVQTGECSCGLDKSLAEFDGILIDDATLNVQTLKSALTHFISEAKPALPIGADPTLWVQLHINMEWLRAGYLALHPEKEEELKNLEKFYSFLEDMTPPGELHKG